jgi:hypothetical protein
LVPASSSWAMPFSRSRATSLLHRVGAKWWPVSNHCDLGHRRRGLHVHPGIHQLLHPPHPAGSYGGRLLPRGLLLLTYWVPARHPSRARGYFYMGIALSGILGNPLSGSLLDLNGVFGLRGIQWMFMVEGLLVVAVGIWAYFCASLTAHPSRATANGVRRQSPRLVQDGHRDEAH